MAFPTAYRSHTCNDLTKTNVGEQVKLSGWVNRVRDHGGVIFIDLRDHYGITQIVFDPQVNEELHTTASGLKSESVIFITGEVLARSEETVNSNLTTGEIEIRCDELTVDSLVGVLPFPVADETKVPEDLRLRYRFIDLRRQKIHNNILLRSKVIAEIRQHLTGIGFTEYQTPILTVSSPEGARDYLVPSRLHPGKFYALPQAPQQYKQLVMCSGFDKYFQIAPCFRDEDARADRSPGEFYQLDMEMSFIEQDDLFGVLEKMFEHLVNDAKLTDKKIVQSPFPRLTFKQAMDWYGSDKPDIRYDMKMIDLTDIFEGSGFKAFAANTSKGRAIKAIVLPDSANEPRSFFDKLEEFAKGLGSKGLAYINYKEDGLKSPILKFFSEEEKSAVIERTGLKQGDTVFFMADKWQPACEMLGKVRSKIAEDRDMIPKDILAFCWIVDFPMYEWHEESKKIEFSHNPFSMPQGGMDALLEKDPLDILAFQYDIVCNGIELSSGAIRNHRPDIMYKAFDIAGYGQEEVDKEFGHMINAFKFGAPPHGGIAPGVDRIVMIFADEPNIREVTMFPMNQMAEELMMASPAEPTPKQLKELHIEVKLPKKLKKEKEQEEDSK